MRSSVYNLRRRIESKESYWKRRPSEIRGYNRTLYATLEDGDYIRVDYNIKEKRVRLYLEDSEEGGNPYYAVISNGKITIERNATTGRVCSLYERLNKRADVFSNMPNKDVLRLINKNYGIGSRFEVKSKEEGERKRREREREKELERTRNKYFKPEERSFYVVEQSKGKEIKRRKVILMDFFDFSIGILICLSLYIYNHNFLTLGVLSAFIGILMGLLDVYFRGREPLFSKMFFFMIGGLASYIYGYYML